MKRHPALQPLSDDHHRALVLARRLRRGSGGSDAAGLAALEREVRREFEDQLEPHFRIEEHRLLPALAARGESRLVEQTLQDHGRLAALLRSAWCRETAREFGELLERHVRFEERVVFPRAEALLSESELAALGGAERDQQAKEQAMSSLERPFRPLDLAAAALGSFDLSHLSEQLVLEPQYQQEGKAGLTLARDGQITVVLEALRSGSELREHRAPAAALVTLLSGRATFVSGPEPKRTEMLPGALVVFAADLEHALEAVEDSVCLIVIGGRGASH